METGNRLFANLEKGRVSIGSIVSMSDLVVSELAGDCGMDFAWIDAEHAPHTIQDVQRHLIALRGTAAIALDTLTWTQSESSPAIKLNTKPFASLKLILR